MNASYGAGQTGTWFSCESPYRNTYSSGHDGVALESDFSVTDNDAGIKITRVVTRWRGLPTTLEWTDESTDVLGSQLDNEVDYRLSGLVPDSKHLVYVASPSILVYDGKQQEPKYRMIWGIAFSPDSAHLAYKAAEGRKEFVEKIGALGICLSWLPIGILHVTLSLRHFREKEGFATARRRAGSDGSEVVQLRHQDQVSLRHVNGSQRASDMIADVYPSLSHDLAGVRGGTSPI